MLKKIKKHLLGLAIGSSGWIILATYIIYEYREFGAFSKLLEHFGESSPLVLLFHIMILLAPVMSTLLGYLAEKKTELQKELAEAKEFLENIIESSADSIITLDKDGRIIQWNKSAARIFGYEDALGKEASIIIPDELIEEHKKALEMANERGVYNYETTRVTKDGQRIPVEISTSILKDRKGNILGYIEILRDITERKEAERKLRESRDAYVKLLQEKHRAHKELQAAYNELKTLDKMKADIIANVRHELKTPITIVKGALELLEEEIDGNTKLELIKRAKKAIRRQEKIIDDLIEAAELGKRKPMIKLRPIEIKSIITDAIEEARQNAAGKNIRIDASIQEKLPQVVGDSESLKHVLRNLLDNAIKFNQQGGKVFVEAREKGEFVEVSIQDTGIGIASEHLNKIFEPLYQVDSSSTRRYSGTGMGLAVAKEIIKLHHGDIGVESTPGKGSKFWFRIPKRKK